MNVELLEWMIHIAVFGVVTYVVFIFFTHFGKTAAEVQEEKIRAGETALAELYIGLSAETFFFLRILSAVVMFLVFLPILKTFFALVMAGVGYVSPGMLLKRLREKRVKLVETQLVEGLELRSSALPAIVSFHPAKPP